MCLSLSLSLSLSLNFSLDLGLVMMTRGRGLMFAFAHVLVLSTCRWTKVRTDTMDHNLCAIRALLPTLVVYPPHVYE